MRLKLLFIVSAFLIFANENLKAQWQLTGNSATDTAVNFIGTTDTKGFKIRTNNVDRVYVGTNNRVGFGTNAPVNNLDVVNNGAVTLGIFRTSRLAIENGMAVFIQFELVYPSIIDRTDHKW